MSRYTSSNIFLAVMDFFDHFWPTIYSSTKYLTWILRVAAEDMFMTISCCALHFQIIHYSSIQLLTNYQVIKILQHLILALVKIWHTFDGYIFFFYIIFKNMFFPRICQLLFELCNFYIDMLKTKSIFSIDFW